MDEKKDLFRHPGRIAVLVYPQVEELDFVGFYQVLQSVKKLRQEVDLVVEIVGTTASVHCANGLMVQPHSLFNNLEGFDAVMIPGGRGWSQLLKNIALLAEIRVMAQCGKLVCSVCTGAFVLAEAGVLKDRKATTHWRYFQQLKPYCLEVLRDRVVRDGNVITAGGVACSLDLGLNLIKHFYGAQFSKQLAKRLEIKLFD
ncbi:MAG: DJ-1/PfpI family protein [bacterium]